MLRACRRFSSATVLKTSNGLTSWTNDCANKGYHSLFLNSHPDDDIHVGAVWERTLWLKLKQSRGVVVLCTEHWLKSPWCVAEAMMAPERGKPLFLLATAEVIGFRIATTAEATTRGPALLPDFLKDTQFLRARPGTY